jgi:diguanylate cyclase (GGDEF)-like protein/PAS domain S-box-containing protein
VRRFRDTPATRGTAIAVVSRDPLLADAAALRRAGANVVVPPDANPALWDTRLEELLRVPRRRDARIPVRLETWARMEGDADAIEARALNISVNGLLLESPRPLEVGQKLDLRFRLPGREAEVEAVGEVVRQDGTPRSGIRFVVLRGDGREAIDSFVEAGTASAAAVGGALRAARPSEGYEWEAALRTSEALRAAILESSLDGILILSHEGRILDLNPGAEAMLGFRRADLAGRTLAETIAPPRPGDPQRQALAHGLATGAWAAGQRVEMTVDRADGVSIPVEISSTTALARGRPFYAAFLRDLTAERRARLLEAALDRITEAPAETVDVAGVCASIHAVVRELMPAAEFTVALENASGELEAVYPREAADARGCALSAYVRRAGRPFLAAPAVFAELAAAGEIPAGSAPRGAWLGVPLDRHGRAFGVVSVAEPDPAALGEADRDTLASLAQAIGVALERKQAEARIHYLAYYDGLTGLPNRHLLLDRMQLAIAQAARDRNHIAVLFLGLDGFKAINDSLGHSVGDLVLKEAAARLDRHVRKGDTLARIGGDEFVVVIRALRNPPDAAKVAQTLQGSLRDPVVVGTRELFVTASVGISVFPDDGMDAETMLKNADTALDRAKKDGRDSFRLYDASMNAEAMEKLRLEHGLRRALDRDELVTYYQPILDLATGRIHGVEALLRWRHAERGLVLPRQFIHLAETTGIVRAIGPWGLRMACAQAKAWQDAGHAGLGMAVNLSARQLQSMNLVAEVTRALEASGLPASSLELEITESSAMDNPEATIRALAALKALGVRVSVDDFGIGYSSLSQLQRLPIDTLKIDQSFVRDITTDPGDAAIAAAVISLGHTLKLKVVAEGVETEAQLAFLAAQGCDRVQGFHLAKAVPPEECEAFLRAHRPEDWRRR